MKKLLALFLLSFVATDLKAAELIRVPLHIHYLKSSVPEINAPKDKVDIKKLLKEANQIWKPADIQFFIKEKNVIQADEKGRLRLSLKAALAEEGGSISPIAQGDAPAAAPAAPASPDQQQ